MSGAKPSSGRAQMIELELGSFSVGVFELGLFMNKPVQMNQIFKNEPS